MASYSSPTRKTSTARSLSLPLESNPILSRISKELKRLKSSEESSNSSAESISIGLIGIAELYGCVGEFLSLPLTQQSLSLHQNDAFITQLVHTSSKLLEICMGARDAVVQLKEEASRRFQGEEARDEYFRTRKRVMKSAKKLHVSFKRMERDVHAFGSTLDKMTSSARVDDIIRVLRCVTIITVSVLEALVSFFGMPPVSRKVCLMTRMMSWRNRKMGRNELENVDVALSALSSIDVASDLDVKKRVHALESGMEGILNGLEGLLTKLTRTRASLLEIITI